MGLARNLLQILVGKREILLEPPVFAVVDEVDALVRPLFAVLILAYLLFGSLLVLGRLLVGDVTST